MRDLFKPANEMTFDTVLHDRKKLIEHCKNKAIASLTLDLIDVKHCDSAGLALLIEAKRLAQFHQKAYQLLNTPPLVKSLALFCGVESILELKDFNPIKEVEMVND